MADSKVYGVGILGCGDVAQVIHLPTLLLLSELYKIVSVCDISPSAAQHCASKYHVPHHTTEPLETINNPEVDVIFNLASDDQHAPLTIQALAAGKNVMLEKPITLSLRTAEVMLAKEQEARASTGAKVFVGYMRRYAPTFVGPFKRELESIGPIKYARVRDIIGANSHFIEQSGTGPRKFTDHPANALEDQRAVVNKLVTEAWNGKDPSPERVAITRFMCSLGSHDISLMREALGGPPKRVDFAARNDIFINAMMTYVNPDGSEFQVCYESAWDEVPRFDAHIQVYGMDKTVKIQYDTPFIKGLPIVVEVQEKGPNGEMIERRINASYEDAFTAELRALHECLSTGKEPKTTLEDALDDLRIYQQIYEKIDGLN